MLLNQLQPKSNTKTAKILVTLLLCFISIFFMLGMSACYSEDVPIPEEYRGRYYTANRGCAYVSEQLVSGHDIYMNELTVNGIKYSVCFISFKPYFITYNSDGTFSLTAQFNIFTSTGKQFNSENLTITGRMQKAVFYVLSIDGGAGGLIKTDEPCLNEYHSGLAE